MHRTKQILSNIVVYFLILASANGERFLTFNAGLAVGLDSYALERLDNIDYALQRLSLSDIPGRADVICLQGYWAAFQSASVIKQLSTYLPYAYAATPSDGVCWCTEEDLQYAQICIATQCSTLSGTDLTYCQLSCFADSVAKEATSLVCTGCLTSKLNALILNQTTFNEAVYECLNVASTGDPSSCFVYGGSSGNLLLSRYPFKNVDSKYYSYSFLSHNSASYAQIALPQLGDLNVFCTNLIAPSEKNITLTSYFNYLQVGLEAPTVVLGDFSHGPAVPQLDVSAQLPDNFNFWAQYGFSSALLKYGADPSCTYCASNSLAETSQNTIVDHIMVRNVGNSISAQLVLNTETTILDISTKQAKRVPYSAHYGVAADIGDSSSGSAVRAINSNSLWKVMVWAYARTVAELWTFLQ